jgi:NADH:ubiquinone oxidoreductase subunit 2 (subunit N)
MSGPVLPLIGPLLLALLLFLIRRWPRPAAAAGLGGLMLLRWLLLEIELEAGSGTGGLFQGGDWLVLGRSLTLSEPLRDLFAFVYLAAAFLVVLALLAPQGRLFYPLTVALLSPLAAALVIQPLVFGVILLLIATAAAAILIQDGQPGATLASFRYLKIIALAAPLLLLAGWLAEENLVSHFSAVRQLMLTGLIIVLGGVPFQLWVIPIWQAARPLVPVVVFGLMQLFLVAFATQFMAELPAVQRNSQFLQLLQLSGAFTVLLAGFLAWTADDAERLIGHLLLVDMGATLFLLGMGHQSGLVAAHFHVMLRLAGLALAGLGMALLRSRLPANGDGRLSFAITRGWGRRWPWVAVLIVYGGLSLIGLPLTPGFAGRWLVVTLAGGQADWLLFLLVIGIGAATAGAARYLAILLSPADQLADQAPPLGSTLPRWQQALIGLLLLLAALLAVAPHWLMKLSQRMAAGF